MSDARRPDSDERLAATVPAGLSTPGVAITAAAVPSQLGRYRVSRPLGSGGMGVVYLAEDPELGRQVAIKLLRDEHGGVGVLTERLRREAQALARLSHPNVVAVYDVGVANGRLYLVMPVIDGAMLDEWLASKHAGPREIVAAYGDAGRGLSAVHAAGLVHCDFKPSNVLVDRAGVIRVSDFGLARIAEAAAAADDAAPAEAGAVRATIVGGTPAYMAPEQFDNTPTAASDQFAFAVALWEALAGERPFAGDSVGELRTATSRGERRAMPRRANAPAYVVRALEKALAPSPGDRFATLDDLLAALTPPRWRRRVAIGGVAAIALGTTAAAAAWLSGGRAAPIRAAAAEIDASVAGRPVLDQVRQLTRDGTSVCCYAPTVDESGVVVFDRTEGDAVELYTVPLAGGAERRVTSAPTWEWRAHHGRRPGEVVALVHDTHHPDRSSIAYVDVATGATTTAIEAFSADAVSAGGAIYYLAREGTEVRRQIGADDHSFVHAEGGNRFQQLAASPRGDRIALVGEDGRVCVTDATTPSVRCLSGKTLKVRPAFSSDGRALYYAAGDGIHRRDLSDDRDELVVSPASVPGGLAVAPDGSTLVYSACGSRSSIVDWSEPSHRLVVDDARASEPVFGPHGELAWIHTAAGEAVLMARTADGHVLQLTRPDDGAASWPAFDATGTVLAYASAAPHPGIHVVAMSGGAVPRALTENPEDVRPVWTDHGLVAFTRVAEGQVTTPFVVSAEGEVPRQVGRTGRLVLAARGDELLVISRSKVSWIDVARGVERKGPVQPDAALKFVAISPDRHWLVYQSGSFGQDLWRLDLTKPGAKLEQLPSAADGQIVSRSAITDDGHVLLAAATWSGDIFAVPAADGTRF